MSASNTASRSPSVVTATLNYKGTQKKVELNVPNDLTEFGLEIAVKRYLNIAESQKVAIHRLSKSSGKYVVMNRKEEYDAIFRSLKVKKKFTFNIYDCDGKLDTFLYSQEQILICLDDSTAVTPEQPEENVEVSEALVRQVSDVLKNDNGFRDVVYGLIAEHNEELLIRETAVPCGVTTTSEVLKHQRFSALCDCCDRVITGVRYKCLDCEDFDYCPDCIGKRDITHPNHSFVGVHDDADILYSSTRRATNRPPAYTANNVCHQAYCDNCNFSIVGKRFKCLNCPDYDLCSGCFQDVKDTHPKHGFARLHNAEDYVPKEGFMPFHENIMCDGPLCKQKHSCIRGVRYKCSMCVDVDFCGSCESSPSFDHNPDHPLIKIKIPLKYKQNLEFNQKIGGETVKEEETEEAEEAAKYKFGDAYSAVLEKFTFDSTSGCLTWVFRNTGKYVWPRYTSVVSSDNDTRFNWSFNPFITKPNETATFLSFIKPDSIEKIPRLGYLETPGGINFGNQAFTDKLVIISGNTTAPVVDEDTEYSAEILSTSVSQSLVIWRIKNVGDRTWPAGVTLEIKNSPSSGVSKSSYPVTKGECAMFSCFTAPGDVDYTTVVLRTPDYKEMKVTDTGKNQVEELSFETTEEPVEVQVEELAQQQSEQNQEEEPVEQASKDAEQETTGSTQSSQSNLIGSTMVLPKLPRESPETSVDNLDHETESYTHTCSDDAMDEVDFSETESTVDGYDVVDMSELSEEDH